MDPKEALIEVKLVDSFVLSKIGEGSDIDYVLKLMYFPSLRYAETFDIKFNHASPMEDMSFTIKGMSNAMKQSEKMCMSNFDLQEPEIQETSLI